MAGPLQCRVARIFLLFFFTANNLWAVQSTTAREESVLFTRGARLIFLHSLGKFLLYFFFFQIKHGQLLIDLCLPPFFFHIAVAATGFQEPGMRYGFRRSVSNLSAEAVPGRLHRDWVEVTSRTHIDRHIKVARLRPI